MRPSGGDVRALGGTSGDVAVTGGASPIGFWQGAPLIAVVLGVVCTINVLTVVQNAHVAGVPLPVWQPVIWEATSAVTDFAGCYLIWLALMFAPPVKEGWLRCLVVQAIGTVAFSALHVLGMWALRVALYRLLGAHYRVSWAEGLYEYPKDVLAYVGFASLLWLAPRLFAGLAAAQRPPALARDAVFDIQDGARTLRIPLGDILAVRAAGNYVEFLLRDERRPLMRAPLSRIEARLGAAGFTRTHRSWLVNEAAVRAIEPAGSGDYRLVLAGGAEAPLSRRFPQALGKLRRGA
jgi:hypothetical protein